MFTSLVLLALIALTVEQTAYYNVAMHAMLYVTTMNLTKTTQSEGGGIESHVSVLLCTCPFPALQSEPNILTTPSCNYAILMHVPCRKNQVGVQCNKQS